MFRAALLGACLATPSGLPADDEPDVPKDLAPFQGSWKIVSAAVGGTDVTKSYVAADPDARFVFTGNKAVLRSKLEKQGKPGTYAVNPKKKPAEIDMFSGSTGMKSVGIYKFGPGPRLTLCFVKGGADRPSEFDSSFSPDCILLVLEKVKE